MLIYQRLYTIFIDILPLQQCQRHPPGATGVLVHGTPAALERGAIRGTARSGGAERGASPWQ